MKESKLETFLTSSPVARRAGVEARIVVRRFTATVADLRAQLAAGRLAVEGTSACELVAGGVVLARGRIEEENGSAVFRVTEVVS